MAVNPLMALLQQVGIMPQTPESDVINVVGRKKVPPQAQAPLIAEPEDPDAAPIRIGNRDFIQQGLEDAERSRPGARKGDLQHKGMFGTKGTLRDILGMVGDAFLVNSGNKAVYAPQRQQEKIADALAGFTQGDPRAAIERLAALPGGAEFAEKLYDNTVQNQARQTTAQSGVAKNKGEMFKEGSRLYGQAAGAIARNPKLAERMAPLLQKIKEEYGLGDEFTIPGVEESDLAEAYQYSGTPTQAQIADTRKVESSAQRERLETMKEQGRNKRYTPPQPRAQPQPTAAAIAAPLLAKVQRGQPLTKGEQEALVRTGFGPDRGKKGRGAPTTLPPGLDPRRLKKIN